MTSMIVVIGSLAAILFFGGMIVGRWYERRLQRRAERHREVVASALAGAARELDKRVEEFGGKAHTAQVKPFRRTP